MNEKYLTKSSVPEFIEVTTNKAKFEPRIKKGVTIPTPHDFSLEFLLLLSLVVLIQLALGVGSYSGQGTPPLYGDYEAQRHWMEITYNLPMEQWYVNGTMNDLQYWGLDYPPLTAYHHYLLGKISDYINPQWIELFSSRGHESIKHKIFMRISAIIPFFIFYLPPILAYFYMEPKKVRNLNLLFCAALFYPGLLVIDNSHFQYNSVSLGFFLFSYIFLVGGKMLLGSILFVFALNYKQMELYHSLPIFIFILSRSLKKPLLSNLAHSFLQILKIGITVIATFAIIWSPFILNYTWKDVLIRIFPFNRGIYEDKVASFWCAFSFILKRLPIQKWLIHMSTAAVLIVSVPSLIALFLKPSSKNFRMSLFLTSLSFFLFSFHVHEKTILLVSTCAILLLPDYAMDVIWFLQITNISLFSLCVKDGNPMIIILFGAYFIFSSVIWRLRNTDENSTTPIWFKTGSVITGFVICLLELFGPVPAKLPHIYQLANSFYCCIHFLYFLILFQGRMIISSEKNKLE